MIITFSFSFCQIFFLPPRHFLDSEADGSSFYQGLPAEMKSIKNEDFWFFLLFSSLFLPAKKEINFFLLGRIFLNFFEPSVIFFLIDFFQCKIIETYINAKKMCTLSLQFHHRESSVYLLKFNTIQCSMLCCFRNASIVYHYKSVWNMKIQFNSTFGSFNKMTSSMTNVKMAMFYISKFNNSNSVHSPLLHHFTQR